MCGQWRMLISISIVRTGERGHEDTEPGLTPDSLSLSALPSPACRCCCCCVVSVVSRQPATLRSTAACARRGTKYFLLRCRYFCARVLGYCCLVDVRSLVAGEGAGHGGGAGRGGGAPAGAAPGRHQPHAGAAAPLLALIFTFNQLELELNICGLNVCCLVWSLDNKSFITEINMMKSKL